VGRGLRAAHNLRTGRQELLVKGINATHHQNLLARLRGVVGWRRFLRASMVYGPSEHRNRLITARSREMWSVSLWMRSFNWIRTNSMWPMPMGGLLRIELMAVAAARFDIARFGAEVMRFSPRQADCMIVAGTVTYKMAPQWPHLRSDASPQMGDCHGGCASTGACIGLCRLGRGWTGVVPVDVYISGFRAPAGSPCSTRLFCCRPSPAWTGGAPAFRAVNRPANPPMDRRDRHRSRLATFLTGKIFRWVAGRPSLDYPAFNHRRRQVLEVLRGLRDEAAMICWPM